MSAWVIGGTTLDYAPAKDTNWVTEPVFGEHHPIGATSSIIQDGGNKSPTRQIEGITKSTTVRAAINGKVHTNVSIVDHRGESSTGFMAECKWDEVMDVTNLGQTFRYSIKFIKR